MTEDQKYQVHLEMVIWDSLPEGVAFTSIDIQKLMDRATPCQKLAARSRGLTRIPLYLEALS